MTQSATPQPAKAEPETPAASPRALYVLLLVVFINLVGFGIVIPLLPFYAKSLNAAPWQITALFSAYSLGQFFAEPFWGRMSDRIGRRPVLIITILANTAAYVALAFAPNLWAAFAIRLVGGFATGNISTIQGYMADVTPPEQRAGRMGLLGAAFGAGFVIGPALGGLLAHPEAGHLGFQIPLFAAAGLSALASLGVFLFVVESRSPRAVDAPRPHRRAALEAARSHPVLSRILLVTLVSTAAFAGMESIFGLWTEARFGWGPQQVGLCFAVIGIVASIGQGAVTGRLARRFGEPRVLIAGLSIIALSLTITPFAPNGASVPLFVGLTAFGQSLVFPCVAALISRSTASDQQGAMLGLNMAAGSLARMAGPMLAGPLFGLAIGGPYWFGALLTLPAIALAVMISRSLRRAA
ncbi:MULTISPECIES: MFS transporter [unclassified Caulobacter]|uniref:MFS transporter n=1 Tax=unclassified Caulobacter TaxID=2648921 RepID=UPI000D347DD2|nr:MULTISPECIES: MFS transporter [unclassified Caulobacter]PTS87973.1 MFS transporter [Caulobacter sp. HMWF009]PTT08945.1 MFS transporter [Caulobacter sp. HMWF025]